MYPCLQGTVSDSPEVLRASAQLLAIPVGFANVLQERSGLMTLDSDRYSPRKTSHAIRLPQHSGHRRDHIDRWTSHVSYARFKPRSSTQSKVDGLGIPRAAIIRVISPIVTVAAAAAILAILTTIVIVIRIILDIH